MQLEGVDDEAAEIETEAPVKQEIKPHDLLLSASLAGDSPTVQTLISSGTSVNSKGEKDYTALHNATRNGHTVTPACALLSGPLLTLHHSLHIRIDRADRW
eukprot:24553-Rhodomonas_salina.1